MRKTHTGRGVKRETTCKGCGRAKDACACRSTKKAPKPKSTGLKFRMGY